MTNYPNTVNNDSLSVLFLMQTESLLKTEYFLGLFILDTPPLKRKNKQTPIHVYDGNKFFINKYTTCHSIYNFIIGCRSESLQPYPQAIFKHL